MYRSGVAESFSNWLKISGTGAGNGDSILRSNFAKVFDVIEYLGGEPDDGSTENYKGKQKWAYSIIDGVTTFGMMKQDFMKVIAPTAYGVLARLSAKGYLVKDTGVYVKEQASTMRCELFKSLLRCAPHTETVVVPNAAEVISNIICSDKSPKTLKDYAKQALSSMVRINKDAMANSGMAIMNIIAAGANDDLIFTFLSMPELYTNDPACLHDHIELVLSKNWMHVCSLINTVASKKPEVLVPHTGIILDKIKEAPAMGAISIGILKEIAKIAPEVIYPFVDRIINDSKGVTGAAYAVAGCISSAALTKSPVNAGDLLLPKLIDVMKSTEAVYLPAVLSELSNIKDNLSDKSLLAPYMDYIISLKPSSSVIVQGLEDFYAGRSLKILETRVDAIEVRITELNNKVAESCSSFEDVVAYVDANIMDMKDFVGEVVKKLPAPKRLEVVGTLRKTLILHFECVHTGYEFPIVSKEWSKWLKMGFSLAKAGKAVFDIGTGNPLGLLSTGIDCVKGIYDAYKSNDDDEFNTYITQPFLTSTEQDQLLEKLRDQGFFEKMAYDNQAPGWYLLKPEIDGAPPAGEAGSVSKVWTKKGYGVGDAISSGASTLAAELELSDMSASGLEVGGAVIGASMNAMQEENEQRNPIIEAAADSTTTSSPLTPKSTVNVAPGGRAAAMRNQMSAAGTLDTSAVDAKLQLTNQIVDLQNRVSVFTASSFPRYLLTWSMCQVGELESKNAKMEKKIQEMEAAIDRNAANGGGCCTIS